MFHLVESFSSLESDFSPPEPVPVEVGEAVDDDGHRQHDGEGAEDGAEAADHFTHSGHRSYRAYDQENSCYSLIFSACNQTHYTDLHEETYDNLMTYLLLDIIWFLLVT
jgi:hypothetical protein